MRLPDQLYLKREPRPLLADFFLAADRFAAERGVLLSLSTDFDELRAVNRRNRDSWVPLLPSISTDYNDMSEHAAFWLKGVSEADGDVVLARACRLYDLPANKTMHDALVDLSLFYDASHWIRPFEHLASTALVPRAITGRFVMSVGGWHHPSVRKLNLSAVAPRIVRAWALNEWNPPLFTSFVEDHLAEKARRAYGMRNQETGITWSGCPAVEELTVTLFWMTPGQLLESLAAFLAETTSERQRELAA
jgi:hypothetical protein